MGAIYSILNKNNGKIYVGQTINVSDRFSKHKSELNNQHHHNSHLQSAWNKYGEDAFEFNVLEYCSDDKLNDNEIWWIDFFNSTNQDIGYNLRSGGNSNFIVSDKTRKKLSEINSGENHWNYSKHHSLKTREKIRESMNGIPNPMQNTEIAHRFAEERCIDRNQTGYYRVTKHFKSDCKQGFYWRCQWREDGKRKSINRVDFDKLKEEVISRGLKWCEISDLSESIR